MHQKMLLHRLKGKLLELLQLRGNLLPWDRDGLAEKLDDVGNNLTWNVAHDEDLVLAKPPSEVHVLLHCLRFRFLKSLLN